MGCGIRYITPCNHQITHNTMTHMDIVPPTIWVIVIVYTMEPHAMFGVECGCPLSFDTNNGMVYNVGAIQTHTHTHMGKQCQNITSWPMVQIPYSWHMDIQLCWWFTMTTMVSYMGNGAILCQ